MDFTRFNLFNVEILDRTKSRSKNLHKSTKLEITSKSNLTVLIPIHSADKLKIRRSLQFQISEDLLLKTNGKVRVYQAF